MTRALLCLVAAASTLMLCLGGCSSDKLVNLIGVLEVVPPAIDFGTVVVNSTVDEEFVLAAPGTREIKISKMYLKNGTPEFSISGKPSSVLPKTAERASVQFLSATLGEFTDTLIIEHNADDSTPMRIALSATAVDPCVDNDGDGYGTDCPTGPDCNDENRGIHPGAAELCNGLDDDCDDAADEDFLLDRDCSAAVQCYGGDACVISGRTQCTENKLDVACFLGATTELCDGIDNNCNCVIDEIFPELGMPCMAPLDVCEQPGYSVCNETKTATVCDPDFSLEPVCCPDGESVNQSGQCCPTMPPVRCDYECTIDLTTRSHDCVNPPVVVQQLGYDLGLATIDMDPDGDQNNGTLYGALELTVHVCDPSGWVFNLADSPSCNGYGGDDGDFSNNGEIHLGPGNDGTLLYYYGNDYVTSPLLLQVPDFVADVGCSSATVRVGDRSVVSSESCFASDSVYGLRLWPTVDNESVPDAKWYLGLNRVVQSTVRRGEGLQQAHLCFQR